MPLSPGEVFAGYTVVRQLGTGGMGAVYLVRHPRLPRLDALKLLRPEFSADPDFARRFLHEADVVAGLSHRNIVSVLDRGEDEGQLWLTMQYIDGIDAEIALEAAGGLLPAERVARIVAETAAALDCAHRHHLVHRDVKPANILLASPAGDDDEQVFLTDFGIAKSLDGGTKLTRTGAVVATFDYASPEQIESQPLDARSDVYSLGCVLHKLLTGRVPYPGASVAAAIHGHLSLPPPRPTALVPWLAPGIDDVVARAMAKDRDERYPTCRALAEAAARALGDFPDPPGPPYTVTLTGGGATAPAVGPMTTERLPREETARLVDLVRRTRFFDLPEDLHATTGRTTTGHLPRGGRPVTIEIRSGRTGRRVVADLDETRRPQALDALVETIQQLPAAAAAAAAPDPPRGAAPATAVHGAVRPASVPAPAPPFVPVGPGEQRGPAGPWVPGGPRGPGGPAGPVGHPPSVPGPPAGRRGTRVAMAAAAVIVLAAAGLGVYLTLGDGAGGGTGSGTSPSASATLSPAEEALRALPRSADPLPAHLLVVPRAGVAGVDLHLVDSATGNSAERLTSAPGDDVAPVVSPDRMTIAFARVSDGAVELRAVAADGGGDSPLFSTPPQDCERPTRPAWNPRDPSQLALVCTGTGDDPDTLLVVGLDGTTVRTLEPDLPVLGDLAFSSNGTWVGYWAGEDRALDGGDLWTLAADGSAPPVPLTEVEGRADADLAWSPDGSTIAFRRLVADDESQIFVMDSDGSRPRSLTSGAIDQDPIWSPEGTQIAFKSDRPGPQGDGDHIWVMDADGSDLRQLASPDGAADSHAPAWGRR